MSWYLFHDEEPCTRGMFLNEDQKKCEYCPVSKYQDSDGNTTCKKCPDGYSTLQMGSKLAQDCKSKSLILASKNVFSFLLTNVKLKSKRLAGTISL